MTKIVSLNVRHGGGKRQRSLARWLIDTQADVLVITEWRSGSMALTTALSAAGYVNSTALRSDRNSNGVAIFSRATHQGKRATPEESLKGELLVVRMEQMAIVGAYFPQQQAKAAFFHRCATLAAEITQPLLIIGDLNTGSNSLDLEPGASTFHCENDFISLSDEHELSDMWRLQHGKNAREWTWRSTRNGFRIDHAFVNRALLAAFPNWRCVYDHSPREQRITDHSAIVVNL